MTWLRFGLAVLLILAIIAVFGDSVHFDFVHYDDHRYVLRRPRPQKQPGQNTQTLVPGIN